jgi:hypothetical protein
VCLCGLPASTFDIVYRFSRNLVQKYSIKSHPNLLHFNSSQSVITSWRAYEILSVRAALASLNIGFEIIYYARSLKKYVIIKLVMFCII